MSGKRRGGDFINEGAYGCVFDPPLTCNNGKSFVSNHGKNTIGKVFQNIYAAKSEHKEAVFGKMFDPQHKFTVPYLGKCTVARNDFKPSDNTQRCIKTQSNRKKKLFEQLAYEYGGKELTTLFYDMGNVKFDDVLQACIPVLEGIKRMMNKNYVHTDIKPANVLIDTQGSVRLNLIDFGMSSNCDEIVKSNNILKHHYLYYPPEFKTYYMVKNNVNRVSQIYNFVEQNYDDVGWIQFYTWMHRRFPKYANELKSTVIDLANLDKQTFATKITNEYSKMTDVYSFGATICEVAYRYETRVGEMPVHSKANYEAAMRNVIIPMMSPNPVSRINIDIAIQRLKHIFQNSIPTASSAPAPAPQPRTKNIDATAITSRNFQSLTVNELKQVLATQGLSQSGTKRQMYERLKNALNPSNQPLSARQLYKKDINKCHKSEDEGGYNIKTLRAIARKLNLNNQVIKTDICNELKSLII